MESYSRKPIGLQSDNWDLPWGKKKNLCSFFSHSFLFLSLTLCRCNGAAGTVAPCLRSPRARLTHAASRCLFPHPVSTATGTLCAAATSAPAAPSGTGNGVGAQTQSLTGNTWRRQHTYIWVATFPRTTQGDFPTAISLLKPHVFQQAYPGHPKLWKVCHSCSQKFIAVIAKERPAFIFKVHLNVGSFERVGFFSGTGQDSGFYLAAFVQRSRAECKWTVDH